MAGVERRVEQLDARQLGGAGMALEEGLLADAARRAQQRQRPPGQVRQHEFGGRAVVVGQAPLGDAAGGVDDALGMGDAHGGGRVGIARPTAAPALRRRLRRGRGLPGAAPPARRRARPHPRPRPRRAAPDTCTSRSRRTSAAGLSSRRPWKTAWRTRPAGVHSVNDTSATHCGRTQCGRALRSVPTRRRRVREGACARRRAAAGAAPARRACRGRSRCRRCRRSAVARRRRRRRAAARRAPGASLRVGPAADDELLAAPALQLDPVPRAAGGVGAVGALAHQPFEAALAGGFEQLRRVALQCLAEAQRAVGRRLREQAAEPDAALGEGQAAQVLAVEERQVEDDIADRFGRRAAVEGVLQRVEVGHAARAGDDDLAVDPRRRRAERAQRPGDERQPRRPVLAAAGEAPHRLAVDAGEHAVAVELGLPQPVALGGRRADEGGEHRLDRLRQRHRAAMPAGVGRRRRRGGA